MKEKGKKRKIIVNPHPSPTSSPPFPSSTEAFSAICAPGEKQKREEWDSTSQVPTGTKRLPVAMDHQMLGDCNTEWGVCLQEAILMEKLAAAP